MAYINNERMLRAVLLDDELMKFGGYSPNDVVSLEQALDSDNYVINTVAQIIKGADDDTSELGLWKEIKNYLFNNI